MAFAFNSNDSKNTKQNGWPSPHQIWPSLEREKKEALTLAFEWHKINDLQCWSFQVSCVNQCML